MRNSHRYLNIMKIVEKNNIIFLKKKPHKNSLCSKCFIILIDPYFTSCGHCLEYSKTKFRNKCLLNFSVIEEVFLDKGKQFENLNKIIKCHLNHKNANGKINLQMLLNI